MQRQYRANDLMSVARLARNLATTPKAAYPQVLGTIYHYGLMSPVAQAWPTNWIAGGMLKLLRWRHGKRGFQMFVAKMQEKDDHMVSCWMAETIAHCIHGLDTQDTDSVGGWSQREIDLLTAEVKFSRDADEERIARAIYADFVLTQPRVPRRLDWDELEYEAQEPLLNLAAMQMEEAFRVEPRSYAQG